ncbi:hypothetical protein FO519_006345 [Halicephalobus sp. NKZ332]|nr:hypothetical protein FO519_006345 [Halicephalobus sp. NKZ332]
MVCCSSHQNEKNQSFENFFQKSPEKEVKPVLKKSSENSASIHTVASLIPQYPFEMYAFGEMCGDDSRFTKRRGPRTTIKQSQLDVLNRIFSSTPKPSKHARAKLALETGLSMRVIQVWFQNRRSKERRLKHLCNFLRHYEQKGIVPPPFGFNPDNMKILLLLVVSQISNVFCFPTNLTGNSVQIDDITVNCQNGETFVKDFILFECRNLNGALESRPIACSPENDKAKTVIQPGEFFVTEHFKYQCINEENTMVLKINSCIDSTGMEVEIGKFFTMEENGDHITTECLGDTFNAKKTLPNGDVLTEGNFQVGFLGGDEKPTLQKGEIISCIRDGKEVGIRCTGCVTEFTSIHVGISGYVKVQGQWTQCRRFGDKCRLINVTQNYVDCKLTGSEATYQNGIYFNDTKGVSTYYCNHGVVSKQGCTLEGKWVLVGEVVYADSGEAFLCDNSATGFTSFNGLKGCVAADGSAKRFQEVWQEGSVMKRCSWTFGPNGISDSKVLQYACVRGSEIIPEFKILQKRNGNYEKCAKNENGDLELRSLTFEEVSQHEKRKMKRIDLSEYFASGGRGETTANPSTSELQIFIGEQNPNPNPNESLPVEGVQLKEAINEESQKSIKNSSCVDLVPFCSKLASYCSDFEKYHVVDGHVEKSTSGAIEELQELSNLSGLNIHRQINPCEAMIITHQKKLKLLVDIICQKTCNSCMKPEQSENIIDKLQKTSRCG